MSELPRTKTVTHTKTKSASPSGKAPSKQVSTKSRFSQFVPALVVFLEALGRLASFYRDKMKHLDAVGITGSVGKTTTKEMVYAVLSEKFTTHKTKGNHNSLVGLPMSLLTLDESYNAAVYEMGMSERGTISALSRIVKPKVALITNVGTMHIEFLGSREGIRDAKCEIVDGLSDEGVLILNGDEPLLSGREGAIYVSLENPD